MKTKILVITHHYLVHLFYEVMDMLNLPVEIELVEVDFGKIDQNLNYDEFAHYDLIITSGAHLEKINKEYKELNYMVPIYPLKFNESDLIKAIVQAKKYSDKILLMYYGSEDYNLDSYCEIMNIDLIRVPYKNMEEVEQILKAYKNKGYNTVIGTSSICEVVKKKNMNGILIYSKDSLKLELMKAYYLAATRNKLMKYQNFNETIFQGVSIPLFLTDPRGMINDVNDAGVQYVNRKFKNEIIGKNIDILLSKPIFKEQQGKPITKNVFSNNSNDVKEIIVPIGLHNTNLDGYLIFIEFIKGYQTIKKKPKSNQTLQSKYEFKNIVHQSVTMNKAILKAKQYAKSESPILIYGESGTGKELLAHSIHQYSDRNEQPFLPVNCSAIPQHILESELFGYEEGAFTGAKKGGKPGYFELAQGGSIFLDEIAEIPLEIQAKLLRVLQEKEVIRLGGKEVIPLDVRIITATNKILPKLVSEGKLREDLYYRINILHINVPPLRERINDIVILFEHLLIKHGMPIDQASYLANIGETSIKSYDWPGNIRELENFVQRLVALTSLDNTNYDLAKCFSDVLVDLIDTEKQFDMDKNNETKSLSLHLLKSMETERREIISALQEVKGNKMKAAEKLGISRTTLWRKMKELKIS